MDKFLLDYLCSGKAWVLVGSGPSIARGYPQWAELADAAAALVREERPQGNTALLEKALARKDYPVVFEQAKLILGDTNRLLQVLAARLRPSPTGDDRIYVSLARWPVPVFLTTNYDDDLQTYLARIGDAYVTYSNSEDHLAHLTPDLTGAIFKLHGDLRSDAGLVLTASNYADAETGSNWSAWRTKLTSVFQMMKVVVVGHSLTDPNIRAVLEAAKQGAGVERPICWIAPDPTDDQVRQYLEKYRIRVIGYSNRDGTHSSLLRLIDSIDVFVPPRLAIRCSNGSAVLPSPESDAAAPGFFVFNKLAAHDDYDKKVVDVIIASIEAAVEKLNGKPSFTLAEALKTAGWPGGAVVAPSTVALAETQAVDSGLLVRSADRFILSGTASERAAGTRQRFAHMQSRFRSSLKLRIRRGYPQLSDTEASSIADDIEASLVQYFRDAGLALATTLFGRRGSGSPAPISVLRTIQDGATRYADYEKRVIYMDAAIGCFTKAEAAERDYLGRVSQGFAAFHMLGSFGAVAAEKLRHAKETVWLIDSNALILALAISSSMNRAFAGAIKNLRDGGVRLFTTEALVDETREHLWFANRVAVEHGVDSTELLNAARGQLPYRKSNAFLEGFVNWCAAGNPKEWRQYMMRVVGGTQPDGELVKEALGAIGVEVVGFQDWPGFIKEHFAERQELTDKVCRLLDPQFQPTQGGTEDSALVRKAGPEAEAVVIVGHERDGTYNISKPAPGLKDSWFVSSTSRLNSLAEGVRYTWPPDGFVRFASTVSPSADNAAADRAFEAVLWSVASSGMSLLTEEVVEQVFGGVIEQTTILLAEQRKAYAELIERKYGEPPDALLSRMQPSDRPLAALQLANEAAAKAVDQAKAWERALDEELKRRTAAERELEQVGRYRRKMQEKQARGRAKAKQQKARSRNKRGSKKRRK